MLFWPPVNMAEECNASMDVPPGIVGRLCCSCTHLVLFRPHPLFLLNLSFPHFLLSCLMSSLPPRNLSSQCPPVLAQLLSPYAKGLPWLIPLLQQRSLFFWSVPFLPQPWLGLSLGIPVFHEYRHFFPICPFSLWMKTKTFELEINFKHLPRGEASLGTLGLLCQASITFAPKEKMGELQRLCPGWKGNPSVLSFGGSYCVLTG